jgi:hypothetical protein
MKKVISYSLFGYGVTHPDCFSFNSYLRGLMINVRMNRLIYPEFENWVYTDVNTFEAHKKLIESLVVAGLIKINIMPDAPLCKAMLWRICPVYDHDVDVVLCRDLDSPTTYRERQCVQYWLESFKTVHAITDSISHRIPMLGGMIGLKAGAFRDWTKTTSWDELIGKYGAHDFTRKGSDQDWINGYIYPIFAQQGNDSITQHYIKGMPNTWLSDYRNTVPDVTVPIANDLRESNDVCGHIGAAGWYESAMFKFLRKHWNKFNDILEIEKDYKDIFYWVNE